MTDFDYEPQDKKAEAVILYDKGDVSFVRSSDGGFDVQFKRTTRIKILKEEGLNRANIEIPLHKSDRGEKEYVYKVDANVYNIVDGKTSITQYDKKDFYTEKIFNYYELYKFALPQVKVGSVIEYQYTVISPFKFRLPQWSFQDKIPVVHSEFNIKMIPYFEYYFVAQNIKKFTYQNSKKLIAEYNYRGNKYKELQHTFIMKDVVAFRDESFITSIEDYLMKVNFQLSKYYTGSGGAVEVVTTWDKFRKELLKNEHFERYMVKAKKQSKAVFEANPDLLKGSDPEKAQKIVEYVKNNYIWNGEFGKLSHNPLKKVMEEKVGSVGDINLFLIGLLRGAGLDANPVILSTRNNGKITSDYPFDHYFNYVVAYIDFGNGRILSDATTPLLRFNDLPIRCINDKGRLIKEKESKWVSIYNHISSYDKTTLEIQFTEDLSATKVDILKSLNGMSAYKYKTKYENKDNKLKKYFKQQGLDDVSEIRKKDYEKSDKPYFISVKGETPTESLMGKIIIRPFYHLPISKNPFTEENRSYDIDLIYTENIVYDSKVNIPEGYKVAELPDEKVVDNDLIKINFKSKQQGNQVVFTYSYFFKKAKYTSNNYSDLKKMFSLLKEKLNVQLVLEPVEN
ncbi:hypothetical protein AVL50_11985 [Flammeovirga sp. SJP92]|nr:hypothetical protein AVL50_11985 [Flammeovirga sp. SJP92]